MNRIQALEAYADKIADINDATTPEFWLDTGTSDSRTTNANRTIFDIRPVLDPSHPPLIVTLRIRDAMVRMGTRDPQSGDHPYAPTRTTTREGVLQKIDEYHASYVSYIAEMSRRKAIEAGLIDSLNDKLMEYNRELSKTSPYDWGLYIEPSGAQVNLIASLRNDTNIPISSTYMQTLVSTAMQGEILDPLNWVVDARSFSTTPRITSTRCTARQFLTMVAAAPTLFFPNLTWIPR